MYTDDSHVGYTPARGAQRKRLPVMVCRPGLGLGSATVSAATHPERPSHGVVDGMCDQILVCRECRQ